MMTRTPTAEALALLESFPPNARRKDITAKLKQRRVTEQLCAESEFLRRAQEEMAIAFLCEGALEREFMESAE